MQVRIVILNYRGAELLPQCLPSIVEAAGHSAHAVRVTVLNNPSGMPGEGVEWVKEKYPQVDIWQSPENLILCSFNPYLCEISEPVVILLNNDIRVDQFFVDPLVQKFVQDPDTFMAAPKVMSFDGGRLEAGASKAGLRWGMFWCEARYPGYLDEADRPSETYSSGFGAFSREKFLTLGGYDERFHPGIMEDVDLSCRARAAGYKLYYEPRSVVYHIGQASFKKAFGSYKTSVLAHRNTFLFMWKNFRGPGFWLPHLFFLPLRLAASVLRGRFDFIQGFWQALRSAL